MPEGKVVFADRFSEIQPKKPGYYFAISIETRGNVAFAFLIQAHRSSKFSRDQAFGPTMEGKSKLFSYAKRSGRVLPFVCEPERERLELFSFDKCITYQAHKEFRYYEFRNRGWYVINRSGPHLMPDEAFNDAEKRVYKFQRATYIGYSPSASTIWSDARDAGIVTDEELNEASRRFSRSWYYCGD